VLEQGRVRNHYPSVLKAHLLLAGSYGRGVSPAALGERPQRRVECPAMFALEGGSFGLQIGGPGHGFRPSGDE